MKDTKINPQIKLDNIPEEHNPSSSGFDKPHAWTPEEIEFYFNKALKVLNKDNYTTSKEFIDLLVNQCLAEKAWNEGFEYFLTKVKELGLSIETDQAVFKKLAERLFYWRTCRMFIHAAGLMPYEEEILKYEIAKHYQPIVAPPTLPPIKRKEVPNAPRRPRPAPAPKPTPTSTQSKK